MKFANRYLLLAAFLVLALVAAACGGNTGEVENAAEDVATDVAEEAEEPAAQEPTEEPMEEPTEEPMEEPTEEPMEEPTEEPAAEEPTEEPAAEEPTEEPAAEEPAGDMMILEDPDCQGTVRRIEAIDEFTVEFEMCAPDPAFLSKVAFTAFAIWPSEYLESTGGSGELLERPIGTGPYMIDTWNRGDSIIFTRYPDYWGEPALAETLVLRWSSEAAARLLELQSGTVHGIDNPGPDDFETIANDPNLQLLERPALNTFYVGMTNTFEPFDDVNVRMAIAMGLDRQRIVDDFYPPGSEVASHFTPCPIANACVGEEWYEFDPEAARQMLADAGFPDGFETTIYYRDVVRGYLPEPGVVAQELQVQLEENLGITAEIEVMESGAFIEESAAGNLDGFYLLGWGADYPHVTNFLDYHFGSAQMQFGDPYPEIYELLDQGRSIADVDEAAAIYEQANNAIKETVPMVPIAHGGSGTAYLATVENPQASPLTSELFAASGPGDDGDQFVFMQNAEPISLFCADETDGESLRGCEQVMEALYGYEINGTDAVPHLAEVCEPNEDLSLWTCTLRQGVTFHDGSTFDANDVVASYSLGLDASNPLHVGNTGAFEYYGTIWGLMNVPAE
jgi:ABC-type transport system substrate-binding protein